MTLGRIDHNGAEPGHKVARDQRSVLFFENAHVAASMARCMENAKVPARLTRKFQPFILPECAVHLDGAIQIARRNRMSRNLHSAFLFQMIRSADVIAMQMREPDLSYVSLFQNAIEQRLLFLIW